MTRRDSAMSFAFALVVLLLSAWMSGAQAAEKMKPGTVFSDCPGCPDMVAIAAGSFQMGVAGDRRAVPVHRVTLNYPFAIGRTEVTEAQFRLFLQRTGYNAGAGRLNAPFFPKRPAVDLDWYAATAYVRWLSRYTGHRYRLPSEAEWDYAAHAGTSTRYWWGDLRDDACGKEYFSEIYNPYKQCASSQNQNVVDVASMVPNPWGLYDMQGNAGEWMQDCTTPSSTYAEVPDDGAPYGGNQNCSSHVLRGLDFGFSFVGEATSHDAAVGFRIVRELP